MCVAGGTLGCPEEQISQCFWSPSIRDGGLREVGRCQAWVGWIRFQTERLEAFPRDTQELQAATNWGQPGLAECQKDPPGLQGAAGQNGSQESR